MCANPPTVFTDSLETFGHGLKICMWFDYNPQIIFCYLFLQVELSRISSIIYIKVTGQGILCERNSSYSFLHILLNFTGVLAMV